MRSFSLVPGCISIEVLPGPNMVSLAQVSRPRERRRPFQFPLITIPYYRGRVEALRQLAMRGGNCVFHAFNDLLRHWEHNSTCPQYSCMRGRDERHRKGRHTIQKEYAPGAAKPDYETRKNGKRIVAKTLNKR